MDGWRHLVDDPDVVLLDGLHAVKHAVRFGAVLRALVAADPPATLALAAAVAPDLLGRLSAELVRVPPEQLRAAGAGQVLGFAGRPPPPSGADLATAMAPVVLLDNPRNLGNVGAVIRVAAGAGAAGVLTTGTVDPWHRTVVRAAAGLHFATAVLRADPGAVPALTSGRPVLAFDAAGDDLRGACIPDNAVLAFGSERHGLSTAVRARADRLLAIPIRPGVSSYNLASAVAVALYHWSGTRSGR